MMKVASNNGGFQPTTLSSEWMFTSTLLLVVLCWTTRTTSAFYIPPPSTAHAIAPPPTTIATTISFFTARTRRQPSSFYLPSLQSATKKKNEEEEILEDGGADTREIGIFQQQWDDRIAELIKYNETFGTVNVAYTHRHVGDEHASIALFCGHVRERQGRLSKERHDQLTSMGFTWEGSKEEKDDQRWEEMYQRLEKYKKNNGDCLVPQRYERDEELGLWVMNQRAKKKRGILKEDRIDKLNSIGFVWVVRNGKKQDRPDLEIKWEARRQEIINFHKENGHYWVPRDFKNKKNPLNSLGRWVHRQRVLHKQGNLRKDRKELLDEIDFTWDAKKQLEKQWDIMFNELKEILSNRTNHEEVFTPKNLGKRLYDWVQHQRMLKEKGTLDDNRKARLNEIGFEWIQVSDK